MADAPVRADLWVAREDGYFDYRIPGLAVAPGGAVLAYCEARQGTGGDWDELDVLLRRSLDGGRIWEPSRVLVDHRDYIGADASDDRCMNNPVCIADRVTGQVHLLLCHNYHRAYYAHSEDDGATWSAPVEITAAFEGFRAAYDWGVLATGPGHGIQLANGRLVQPVWLSTSRTHAHHPNRAGVIYSDDHGATWHAGELVPDTVPNLNETVAAQLADGRVMFNLRNEAPEHRRAVSLSADGATCWSAPTLDEALIEPICFASLVRLPGAGDRLAFVNPACDTPAHPDRPHGSFERRNLTLRLSADGGHTWPARRVLDPGWAGYADLAALPDGTLLCLYERGALTRMTDIAALTLLRMEPAWLEGS